MIVMHRLSVLSHLATSAVHRTMNTDTEIQTRRKFEATVSPNLPQVCVLHTSASPSPRGDRLPCELSLLWPIHSSVFFLSLHEILFHHQLGTSCRPYFIQHPQRKHIHANARANSYSQLLLDRPEPPPFAAALYVLSAPLLAAAWHHCRGRCAGA